MTKPNTRPEVLAPAGGRDKLEKAVLYGADAVYLGGDGYSMRRSAGGFTGAALAEAVDCCHRRGVRAYLTCNTLPDNDACDRLDDFLLGARAAGVDALIVADIGVLMRARALVPEVALHVSTQAGVVNWRAAAALHELGASRVVLARELSVEDIRVIRERTPPNLELEAFVHGAMCMSFSGRCLISDYLTGRGGNRGECAQPCRWKYALVEERRPGEYFPIREEEDGCYFFSARDLCMIRHLGALAGAGVDSFKIEGRAKSAYYAAVTANAYRAAAGALPGPPPAWAAAEVLRVSHRPYGTGFYFGRPLCGQDDRRDGPVRDWEVSAVVERWEEGWLYLRQRGKFHVGDTLELLVPGGGPEIFPVAMMRDGEGNPISACPHAEMALSVPYPRPVPAGAYLRREREG